MRQKRRSVCLHALVCLFACLLVYSAHLPCLFTCPALRRIWQVKHEALEPSRIRAVETGGCPHAAIREDVSSHTLGGGEFAGQGKRCCSALLRRSTVAVFNNSSQVSANLAAVEALTAMHECSIVFVESGGDNLAANFSRELADFTIYVIDVAGGDKVK